MKLGTYHDERYVLCYSSKDLSPTTVQGYESSYWLHVEPYWAGWEMHEIRVVHINTWLATSFPDNPGGAEKAYKVLRQILRSAMGDECYPDDVVDPTTRGVRLPRKPWDGGSPRLKPKEVKRLLVGVKGWEYEPVVICGLWLGLRRSESCGLQWGDIDMRTGLLRIKRGVHYVKGEVVQTKTKTHRSMRLHMLPRVAVERMREIKRDRRAKPSDWIMGDELGVDVHPDRYARRLRAFCKKNGLPHVAPKYFRHTFRVNTRKADIPEQDIQKMLGHKEFETSFIYMELDEDVLREDQRAHERLILRA
ncbi:tyrosine-type recombinase/integrase [Gordonibacter urolithinfaciens]|uniref:tyrosine-type recombinase/integrase n=1 Tax=Gordonibacter urolithinfaciens TaxID=1335613 RepID=UPI001D06370F|nr:site-specific integrase [Gordonibacter urolithinfaciens]MCB7085265.1 site-specific integrase [Gordonibacter urolithinfaciens]